VNETEAMSGSEESQFDGIWYPTFTVDQNQMFLTEEKYMTTTNLAKTTVTIVISETPFYIQNHEAPIAKRPEIIFHNLLFTIVCLEIFGLVFLLFKLVCIPLFMLVKERHSPNKVGHDEQTHRHGSDQEMEHNQWANKVESEH
jgi:hypothetical protein